MKQEKGLIEITLIENIGMACQEYASLKVRARTGISKIVKEMKLYSLTKCEFNYGRDTYLPSFGPFTNGLIVRGEVYRVDRQYDSWNSIYSLCRKFEKSQAQKMKGGERK